MRDFWVVWRMDLFVCVHGALTSAGKMKHSLPVLEIKTLSLFHTHIRTQKRCLWTCGHSHTHTSWDYWLSARSNRWISSIPYSPHLFLHRPPPSLSLSLSLSLSERVTFLPSPSPSLPSLSLLHRHVSGLQVPSSHITFLSSSRPLPFLLSWWVNSRPLGLTLCTSSPALPSNTSCQPILPPAVMWIRQKTKPVYRKVTWDSTILFI